MEGSEQPNSNGSVLNAAPGLIRLAAGAWVRTASWTLDSAVRSSRRLSRAATSGETIVDLVDDVRDQLRAGLRGLIGLVESDDNEPKAPRQHATPSTGTLRDRGAELLNRSAHVGAEDDAHPAYERILEALAPDEARVLRLLVLEGAQPAVDVRTWRPLDVGSQIVAPGLQMIGREAGCRSPERVPAYLNNLFRLGLIWFSREEMEDQSRYQVLEAQPDVVAAMRQAGRSRTIRRSIRLTPFGDDFCDTCLPLHTAEFDVLGPKSPTPEEREGPPAAQVPPP